MTSYILLTGKIEDGGPIQWHISPPPPAQDEPQDGDIERLIREGEDTDEYIDYLEDLDFWRRGGA